MVVVVVCVCGVYDHAVGRVGCVVARVEAGNHDGLGHSVLTHRHPNAGQTKLYVLRPPVLVFLVDLWVGIMFRSTLNECLHPRSSFWRDSLAVTVDGIQVPMVEGVWDTCYCIWCWR